ncbi:MAG: RDD family protein [Flavisolibacter sp.]
MENNQSILSDLVPDETEVSLGQGFLTRIIDIATEVLLILLFYMIVPRSVILGLNNRSSSVGWIIVLVIVIGYQFFFLFLFGKTVGMMVCRVKYLNRDLKPLSIKEKLLSLFRSRFSGIRYYKDI